MSGETEKDVSGWTVDTLKEYADRRLQSISEYNDRRFADQETAVQAALLAAKEAVAAALTAAKEAVDKANLAGEKRFDAVNEFRGQLADQTATLIPRSEAEQRMQTLSDKINVNSQDLGNLRSRLDVGNPVVTQLQNQLAAADGAQTGADSTRADFYRGLAMGISIISLVSVIIGLLIRAKVL